MPEIVPKLVVPSGKNKGRHPTSAGVYRVPAEVGADQTFRTAPPPLTA
ncbi:hypothetical protein [Microtetraspora niveoalba]|nr:hypothetical protein [Microtetraspora niveoalba]